MKNCTINEEPSKIFGKQPLSIYGLEMNAKFVSNGYRYAFGFRIQNAPIDSHDLHGIPGTF